MRALADTAGMSTPERAAFWLDALTAAEHRGRHDTWTAARDRAAKEAGIKLSIAKRIWQRLESMNDVGGTPLLKLMLAYEGLCRRIEGSADAMERERIDRQRKRDAVDKSPVALAAGMAGPPGPEVTRDGARASFGGTATATISRPA